MTDDLHLRLAGALERVSVLLRSDENQEARDRALSPLQARALVALARRGAKRVGELAAELQVTVGTLSAAVTVLEDKGLVAKSSDPEEHRAVVVEPTRRGRTAARRAEGRAAAFLEPALDELEPRQAEALLTSLLALLRACERQGLIPLGRMCVTCRHFQPEGGRGARPHYCHLLQQPIGARELRVDCSEHERADAARLEELWRSLRLGA